jgi:hypothetical protein
MKIFHKEYKICTFPPKTNSLKQQVEETTYFLARPVTHTQETHAEIFEMATFKRVFVGRVCNARDTASSGDIDFLEA